MLKFIVNVSKVCPLTKPDPHPDSDSDSNSDSDSDC